MIRILNDIAFIDANRWKQLISQHLPNLEKFDLYYNKQVVHHFGDNGNVYLMLKSWMMNICQIDYCNIDIKLFLYYFFEKLDHNDNCKSLFKKSNNRFY